MMKGRLLKRKWLRQRPCHNGGTRVRLQAPIFDEQVVTVACKGAALDGLSEPLDGRNCSGEEYNPPSPQALG